MTSLKKEIQRAVIFTLVSLAVLSVGMAGIIQTDFFQKFTNSVTMMNGTGGWRHHGQRPGHGGGFHGKNLHRGGGFRGHAIPVGQANGVGQREPRPDVTAYGFGQVAGYTGILILVVGITAALSRVRARRGCR